jgi:Zn-dependent peptidase ImmA (M78 family)
LNKYQYKSKTIGELENLARGLLVKYPKRIAACRVDIEGVLEDMGISLLPRPNIQRAACVDAFLPRDPNFVIIDEEYGTDLPYFRLIIGEEISHRLLEPELWATGVPKGANIFEIDKQIYDDIEADAYRMALALLMPETKFIERFRFHLEHILKQPQSSNNGNDKINYCVNALANDFEVTFNAVVSRGRLTGLFKGEIKRKELPGAVVF